MNSLGRIVGVVKIIFVLGAFVFSGKVSAVEMDATLQWVRTVPLSTTVSGVIDQVNAAKGDRVRAGQELINLVGKAFVADVAARKAGLKRAENNDEEAGRELERTQELYDRTLLSDHDLQLVEIQRDAATAELEAARAALVKAERDYYYSVVRAPFDAWVLQRNAQPGQAVIVKLQASPLMVLAEAGRMLARSVVDGDLANNIKVGQKAKVTVAGKRYDGAIHFVGMEPVKSGVDEYRVDVIFASGQTIMRVGQVAKVSF